MNITGCSPNPCREESRVAVGDNDPSLNVYGPPPRLGIGAFVFVMIDGESTLQMSGFGESKYVEKPSVSFEA